jgi:hypothetical protein
MNASGKMKILLGSALWVMISLSVVACGSDNRATPNTPPVADAGGDQTVSMGTLVTLDGSGSSDADGDMLTYSWTFTSVPAGSSAALSDSSAINPTFTADEDGSYVVSLIVNDGTAESTVDMTTVTAFRPTVPDTGQSTCYDAWSNEIDCAGTGQDGEYSMNAMSFTDNGDGTVFDNVTGLTWQKQDDGLTYNWYEAAGVYNATHNPGSTSVCDSLSLGGHDDWRLPTRSELVGIINYGTYYPSIETIFFPDTKASDYWSQDIVAFTSDARSVNFSFGYSLNSSTSEPFHARCVRGRKITHAFADNGDGTVTDDSTGLMWQQEDDNNEWQWLNALSYCEGLSLAGFTDWRLPNIKELESLMVDAETGIFIDTVSFPGTKASFYLSSSNCLTSTYSGGFTYVFIVDFSDGAIRCGPAEAVVIDTSYVRCVRTAD